MGESVSRDDLVRQVAERLDLEPAMVMGRVVASQPTTGGAERRRRRLVAAASTQPQRRSAGELTSRERRERALLAMCIAMPEEGREYLGRLSDDHLSAAGARAARLAAGPSRGPASDLPHDDESWPALSPSW